MAAPSVTVIIHTLNEADQISDCIRSVEWAAEIYLIDSYSTDGTPELVRSRFPRVRLEQRQSLGSASQKNYAMDRASNDWVLVVDADERVTEPLRDEVRRVLDGEPEFWAYSVGRRNFVLGKEVHYGGLQRDRVTRLFHRRHARYPNRRVHADLVVDGATGVLRGKLIHFYVRSFDHMIEKMTRYGVWGGAQLYVEGQRTRSYRIFTHAAVRFLRDYILNFGFLDGTRGLIVVGMHVYYTFWKYSKLWEYSELERRGKEVELPPFDGTEERWILPWQQKQS